MEALDTLITPAEVVRYSPIDKQTSSVPTCNFIVLKEEKLFRNCLGWDFYESLMADKIDYSTYTSFRINVNYAIGDIVLQEKDLYECIQVTTGTQTPLDKAYWKTAPKFLNADYEYLWIRYLRNLLAFTIVQTQMVYNAVQQTDQGIVRKKGDTFEAADIAEIFRLKDEYSGDIRDILKNMDEYIMANPDKYPDYIKVKNAESCKKNNDCNYAKIDYHGFNLH